ncbi:MAG TPA: HlyD family efflux transporter periplasmic adaptor subunit [Rhodocyclaceae bacterium]|nr:HlyD family efflux transporter periplasmic adaptor subunit [Rhodocyclaceae bacterium]
MEKIYSAFLMIVLLAGCGKSKPDLLNGYVEAEYLRVASPIAGRLVQLDVQRGDEVKAAAPLFLLDQDDEAAAVRQSAAQVVQAQAQANDLGKGKRPDELAAIASQVDAAKASLRQSESTLGRQRKLAQAGFVSPDTLTTLQTTRDADAAQVREMEAQLRVAKLAARQDSQVAAKAATAAAQAQLQQNQWRLTQKAVSAPATARVDDTLYRVGEWVPAGSPIVSLLEPGAIKVRFFVAETQLAQIKQGDTVTVRCDGCGAPINARISFIADQAEFTPPVIYSKANRERLVFLVEAIPDADGIYSLHPGQPVDVEIGAQERTATKASQ